MTSRGRERRLANWVVTCSSILGVTLTACGGGSSEGAVRRDLRDKVAALLSAQSYRFVESRRQDNNTAGGSLGPTVVRGYVNAPDRIAFTVRRGSTSRRGVGIGSEFWEADANAHVFRRFPPSDLELASPGNYLRLLLGHGTFHAEANGFRFDLGNVTSPLTPGRTAGITGSAEAASGQLSRVQFRADVGGGHFVELVLSITDIDAAPRVTKPQVQGAP